MFPKKGPAGSYAILLTFLILMFAFRIEAAGGTTTAAALTNLPNLSSTSSSAGKSSSVQSSSSQTSASTSSQTPGGSSAAVTNAPPLTTSATGVQSAFHLTGLPTLAGAGIPSVGVPDTAKAPYMQKSSAPEGTVFIAVGAALGFLGASVLAWRGLVAWSLHRSVKRASLTSSHYDSKALLRAPAKGIYSHVGASSNVSLDQLASPTARSSKYNSSPNIAMKNGANPTGSSLFFSPTAGTGMHSSTNRSSGYLPAGYYAPGASAPASGAQMTHIGASPSPLSVGAAGAGFGRTRSVGPSPPSSPGLPPSRGNDSSIGYGRNSAAGTVGHGIYGQQSVSSLNLSAQPTHQNRAPSAYLEDLFENHGTGPNRY